MALSKKKKLLFFGIFIVVLALLFIATLKKEGGRTVTVQTDKVKKGDITSSVSGSARIQPEVQVKISAKVSGQIVSLGVEEGDRVRKGQFLVQLDQEYYQAAKEQSESNLKFAKAGYAKASNEYTRSKKLFADNLISESELENAKSTYEQAEAQVEQNDAALKQARDNLAKTTIVSPMDGIVSKLNKKVGEMAMGSNFTLDEIMVVADLNRMLAETDIDENDVVSVSLGDTAKIMIDAFPDSSFQGIVKEIANTGTTQGAGTQEEVTNFLVKVSMVDVPPGLRPGMSATVDIMTQTDKNVLKVPIQCITVRKPLPPKTEGEIGGETRHGPHPDSTAAEPDSMKVKSEKPEEQESVKVVFIVEDKTARQVEVKTGIQSDTEWEILEGLQEGQEVVSGSYRVLSKEIRDGDQVKIDNSMKKFGREFQE